jgi:hypothetical protein
MNGLIGLTKSINDRESAVRDLSVLERMDGRIQQDRQAEIQAQQAEEMMYERMYQTADGMLEKDRKRINKQILISQRRIREHLGEFGGSKKDFMANGGVSILNGISNSIIRSDEAVRYQENKKNLAKILELKEKGMGHLLAPRDLEALDAYEKNEEGAAITYSGVMNEIEIPDSNLFDYGQEIPVENILTNKSNMMKIKSNYALNYPDKPEPDHLELVEFVKKMGYGGTGSNMARMKYAAEQAKKRAEYDSKTDTTSKKNSYLNLYSGAVAKIPQGLNLEQIKAAEGGYIESLRKNDPNAKILFGEKFTEKTEKKGIFENEWIGLKEGHKVFPGNERKILDAVLGEKGMGYKIEGTNIVGFEPSEDMYRYDGVKLTGDNAYDEEPGDFKFKGLSTALKAKMKSDGTTALMIDRYNANGSIDEDNTAETDTGYGDSEAELVTVIALEDSEGNMVFKEVDMKNPSVQTQLSNAMPDDNIADTVQQQNEYQQLIDNIEKMETVQQVKFESAKKELDQKIFNDAIFKGEAQEYYGKNSGGQQNRNDFIKSFYMAFDAVNGQYSGRDGEKLDKDEIQSMVDQKVFSTFTEIGGITDKLKSYEQGNDEGTMIASWLENMNKGEEKGSLTYKKNVEFAQRWKQVLGLF